VLFGIIGSRVFPSEPHKKDEPFKQYDPALSILADREKSNNAYINSKGYAQNEKYPKDFKDNLTRARSAFDLNSARILG
jgi:hypothetical protein